MESFVWYSFLLFCILDGSLADDVVGCGGFVKSDVDINYSFIDVSIINDL